VRLGRYSASDATVRKRGHRTTPGHCEIDEVFHDPARRKVCGEPEKLIGHCEIESGRAAKVLTQKLLVAVRALHFSGECSRLLLDFAILRHFSVSPFRFRSRFYASAS
jgi:hypothetical protein